MNQNSGEGQMPTLFFVGGQGKSGTTWVQLLLDAHPAISCRGEAHFFDFLAPALQQAFLRYRHQLDENNQLFHELPGFPLPEQHEAFATLRAAVLAAMGQRPRANQVAAVGERTPANVEHLDLIWALFPAARFVHVIRDPRDVAVSLWHHGQRIQAGGFTRQYESIDALAEQLASSWASGTEHSARMGARRSGQYLEIRYEDLLAEGPGTLARLLEFLGITAVESEVEACLQATAFEKLSGGRSHGEEDTGSHFRKGISGDWRNHLSPEAVAKVRERAGGQLERLGYAAD